MVVGGIGNRQTEPVIGATTGITRAIIGGETGE